ncbi:MAG: 50S ribosomal protein L24 [Holosporales bacterium]|jgi:large subunit ribosomal protein L24|nr:50S ribosomal protein L24 [Holosporales bacterium]
MAERWRIKKGDQVQVIAGKEKGQKGEIIRVFRETRRVLVRGLMMKVRHRKPSQKDPGGIVREEGSIHASNVMLIDPKMNRPTRVGVREENGKKVRIAKRSGAVIGKSL